MMPLNVAVLRKTINFATSSSTFYTNNTPINILIFFIIALKSIMLLIDLAG